jgi:hypothetical protein
MPEFIYNKPVHSYVSTGWHETEEALTDNEQITGRLDGP